MTATTRKTCQTTMPAEEARTVAGMGRRCVTGARWLVLELVATASSGPADERR